jgi:hypothetical protein
MPCETPSLALLAARVSDHSELPRLGGLSALAAPRGFSECLKVPTAVSLIDATPGNYPNVVQLHSYNRSNNGNANASRAVPARARHVAAGAAQWRVSAVKLGYARPRADSDKAESSRVGRFAWSQGSRGAKK